MKPTFDDVNKILSFIYTATSVINDFKEVTANFLDDNESISSIPRNYRTLRDKHIAWLNNFITHAENSVPEWSTISDKHSYELVLRRILQFQNNIPSDASLTQTELQFIRDIKIVQDSLRIIRNRTNFLLTDNYLKVVKEQLREDGVNLEIGIQQTSQALENYIDKISKIRAQLKLFVSRRVFLETSVPTVWQRILELRLNRINLTNAAQIIEEIERDLGEPQFLADVEAELQNIHKRANALLNVYFCPILARRAALGGLARIHEIESNVETKSLSNETQSTIKNKLEVSIKSIESIANSAANAINNIEDYIEERSSELNTHLRDVPLTEECKYFAMTIINEQNNFNNFSTHSINEKHFIEFKNACVRK